VPRTPGLGVTLDREQLRTLNEQYKSCGIRTRNDTAEMKKYDPSFTGKSPRY
jgi:glucarate dehydratase